MRLLASQKPLFFYSLLIASFFFQGCSSNSSDKELSNLKGEIVKTDEVFYNSNSFSENSNSLKRSKYEYRKVKLYNSNGDVEKEYWLNEEDEIINKKTIDYSNEKYRKIIKDLGYNYNFDYDKKTVYTTRDDIAEIFLDKELNADAVIKQKVKNGLVISEEIYNKKYPEKIETKSINEWNNGKVTKIYKDELNADVKIIWNYGYNENGDISLFNQYEVFETFSDTLKNSFEYKYDDKGNWIERLQDKEILTIRRIVYRKENLELKNEIIGIWNEVGSSYRREWIDFNSDESFEWGDEEEIDFMGNWKIDYEEKTLTFLPTKDEIDPLKYRYTYDKVFLTISDINGKNKKVFIKSER